jgi:glutathione S-transferase
VIELHIANKNYSSWSLRPWVLLRELGVPFEERLHPFEPASDWTAFRAISPSGKVPCLVDEDVVVWDSLAIAEYLHERHTGVWPADPRARAWARSAAAEMHAGFTALRSVCSMSCGVRIRLFSRSSALEKDLARVAALWADGLQRFGGPFLAGSAFTAADAFFAPVAFRLQTYELRLPEPASTYAARLLALPSMRAWYDEALRETFRDRAHDEECLAHGAIVADLRAQAAG